MGWALRINTNAESKTYYSFRAYLQRHPMQKCCEQHNATNNILFIATFVVYLRYETKKINTSGKVRVVCQV